MTATKAKKLNKKRSPPQHDKYHGPARALDVHALAYARLLANPIGGGIVHPVFPGSDSGYLFRAQRFTQVGNVAPQVNGVIKWTPNGINSTGTEFMRGASDTLTPGIVALPVAPGSVFLQANASSYRCIAASMRVYYNGAELDRSGRVHFGTANDSIFQAGVVDVTDVQVLCQNSARTPQEFVEVLWTPNVGDFTFTNPNNGNSPLERAKMASIIIAFNGLPSGVGVTLEMTAVYEWQPKSGTGIIGVAITKNPSNNTYDNVLDWLIANGETFARGAVEHAPAIAGYLAGSAMRRMAMPRGRIGL